mmetsp:Transcript_1894/g.3885  ORF Transcript_1894/g.3885 Transcript_1894/m.3885 type:complete len:341 (-) Transcript_1894:648-1670(-)
MCCPICTYKASSIHSKPHWKILQRHIMYYLVIPSLQECRIDGADWNQPFTSQTSCKGHSMLFSNTNIIYSVWECIFKTIHSCSTSHGCMHTNNPRVSFRFCSQRISKIICVRHCFCRWFGLLSSQCIVFCDTMHLVRCCFCREISSSLFRDNMQQDRSNSFCRTNLRQHIDQILQIMSIYWTDVIESKLFKQCTACPTDHSSSILINLGSGILNGSWKLFRHTLCNFSQLSQLLVCLKSSQGRRQCTDRLLVFTIVLGWQGHLLVVVQDDNHIFVQESCMIHCFICHTTRDCSISNHCNATVLATFAVSSHSHTKSSRDGCGTMTCSKCIVRRLCPLCKS